MSVQSRGFTKIAPTNNDVTVGGADGSLDNWATKGNVPGQPSPILDSASVDGRFKSDSRDGLTKAMAGATILPPEGIRGHAGTDRILDSGNDQNGGHNASGRPPAASK